MIGELHTYQVPANVGFIYVTYFSLIVTRYLATRRGRQRRGCGMSVTGEEKGAAWVVLII